MARLNGSAFLGVDLQPCKTMTDTLAPVECANWGVTSLEFYSRPDGVPSVWLSGQDHLGATGGPVSSPGGFFLLPPTPHPSPPPPTHPLVMLGLN